MGAPHALTAASPIDTVDGTQFLVRCLQGRVDIGSGFLSPHRGSRRRNRSQDRA